MAPLGTVALAANAFAITAESLCYMPGYGIAVAATAIIGQVAGAGLFDTARRLGRMCVSLGMLVRHCKEITSENFISFATHVVL